MKTTMKKVLSIVMALVLMLSVFPVSAYAEELEEEVCTEDYHYGTTSDDWVRSTNYHWKTCSECDIKIDNAKHDWEDATCTTPATCKVCEATSGEPLGHKGGTATCTDKAVCTACGEEYGEVSTTNHTDVATEWSHDENQHWHVCGECTSEVGKVDHTWTAASCTQPRTCSVCGRTDTEATGHDMADATCNDPATCKRCGETEGVALGHDWNPATCTQPKTCKRSNCRETEGNALGHDWSGDATVCRRAGCGVSKEAVPQITVYYNLNVNASKTKTLAKYDVNTPMSEVLADLAFKDFTYPGKYPTWYSLAGWYEDADCTDKVSSGSLLTSDITLYAKWNQNYKHEVILKLYTNGNTSNVVKVVDAFYYVQNDGKLSKTEVKEIADKYMKAHNTNAGLIVYGPFDTADWEQYTRYNNRLGGQEQIIVDDSDTTVVYAMIHNVAVAGSHGSTAKADSTNPKTGDMIFMPVAVLGLSVSALAVLFYLNKKRAV